MRRRPASGPKPSPPVDRRSRGFALLIVLWTLVLIAFIVAHLTASGRIEILIARNLVDTAVAEAADDGAISEAIFNLSDPNPDQRWPIDGTTRELSVGKTRVMVQLEDEAWRINPSTASPELLEALLRVLGNDRESARSLAAAIAEWVVAPGAPGAPGARSQDALIAKYLAAGLDYGPPGAPLETLDELGRVLGMTPPVLAAMRPHLTLFGPPVPNPVGADPVVAAALASNPAAPQPASAANPAAAADVRTVRITATAVGPGNARVRRVEIVRIEANLPQGYAVLARDTNLD